MTATVSELRRAPHARYAYLLAIEGVQHILCSDRDVPESFVSDYDETRRIAYGLTVPDTLEFGTDGILPTDGGATFLFLDSLAAATPPGGDGTIAPLSQFILGNLDAENKLILGRIQPGTTPLPLALFEGGDFDEVEDGWVGAERFSDTGERRAWQCIPFSPLPGQQHVALNGDTSDTFAPVVFQYVYPPVSDGLRCALYQIVYDPETEDWHTWQNQYTGGALIWWGTLRTLAKVEGRSWSIKCDGPESWLRRQLGRNVAPNWIRAYPKFIPRTVADYAYSGAETLMAAWIQKVSPTPFTSFFCDITMFDVANELTQTTKSGLVGEIATILNALKVSGTHTYKNHAPFGDISFTYDYIGIRIDESGSGYRGELHLVLHESVWHRLGFDPIYQNTPIGSEEGQYEANFRPVTEPILKPEWYSGDGVAVPSPPTGYYYEGVFTTLRVGEDFTSATAESIANGGLWRTFLPTVAGGYLSILPGGGQRLGISLDPMYLESQLGRADSGKWQVQETDTDSTRWLLLRAPYRERSTDEPKTLYQVVKVDWVDDGYGSPIPDSDSWLTVVVDRFEDPRQWGIHEKKLSRAWAVAGFVEVLPLSALKYSPQGEYDYVHHVLLRILLSTGTAAISGKEYDAQLTLTPGDNHNSQAVGTHRAATDAEIYDLGLSIPKGLVDWGSYREAMDKIPGGWSGPLGRCLVAWAGTAQAQELLGDLLASRGIAIGLSGKKYTCYAANEELSADDAVLHIASGNYYLRGVVDYPEIELSSAEPVDLWEIKSGIPPSPDIDAEENVESLRSRDVSAPWRQGRTTRQIRMVGLSPAKWWEANEPKIPWEKEAATLFGQQLSSWYSRPHHVIHVSVQRDRGQDLRPGDVVTFSHPELPSMRSATGASMVGYGLTAVPGRVIKTVLHLDSGHVDLTVVLDGKSTANRRWGPIARLVESGVTDTTDRYDPATKTWKCMADGFGHGSTVSDVTWFAEPEWSDFGGNMLVYVWQYDGLEWSRNCSFTVSSVDTDAHTITATGAYTGTFYERQYTILTPAPYDVQTAAWAKILLSWVTSSGGGLPGTGEKGGKLL